MKYHYIEQSLIAPVHKVTVALIGVGGTGSYVLSILARMNAGLVGIGHPGFHVTAYDGDNVSESNIGRQLFSKSDLGKNKADVFMERINRFYSTNWESINHKFVVEEPGPQFNIIITCVDNIQIRKDIQKNKFSKIPHNHPYYKCYYWLDFGNGNNYGQVILGTMGDIIQPNKDAISVLPTVIEKFEEKQLNKNEDEPSCSTLEALNRQELLVNSSLAEFGMNILWKLFRVYKINQTGLFMNLDTMTVNPIKL